MSRFCLQGAAQGVWKEMTVREVGGREDMWAWNSVSVVMSIMEDIVVMCRD